MDQQHLTAALKTTLLALTIIVIGIIIVNQYVSLTYKVHLIKEPCTVCLNDNPQIKLCKEFNFSTTNSFSDYINWSNNLTKP